MKVTFSLLVGVSLFAILGNAQDGGAPVAYAIQGSVAYNRTLHEKELARAAERARRDKELKAAMAAQAPGNVVHTTAADFLKANRPAMPAPQERPEPIRREAYVPPFEDYSNGPSENYTATSEVVAEEAELPKKEIKLFSWLKGKKAGTSGSILPAGTADYSNPYTPGAETEAYEENTAPEPAAEQLSDVSADPGSPEIAAAQEEAIQRATVGNGDSAERTGEKPKLFGKLFGKNRGQSGASNPPAVAAPVEPNVTAVAIEDGSPDTPNTVPEVAEPVAVAENDIPDSPDWAEQAPPVPNAPEPALASADTDATSSIFVRRPSAPSGGETATIKREGNANVEGVKVRLYEGTQVTVVKTGGLGATIQLPDGRMGTTQRSMLRF